MNRPGAPSRRHSQHGLSLVEVLVGLVIGVIGMLAIFQTVGIWNRHTQTTSSGGDAQVAGTLGLFDIERDFKESGHGFGETTTAMMGCQIQAYDQTRGAPDFQIPLRPIDIVVGALGVPDQINVLYGDSSFFVEGQQFTSSTPTSNTLRRRGGFRPGDVVLLADDGAGIPGSANCSLAEITSDANPDFLTVDHVQGNYTTFYAPGAVPSRFNRPGGPAFPYAAGTMFNLGPRPQWINWQIVNGRTLQRNDQLFNPAPAAADQIADGVVNLKAEYGVDINNNTVIDPGEWLAAIPVGSNWNQVLAVRVALLVRSRQFERNSDPSSGTTLAVTPNKPVYFGGPFTMANVDGTLDSYSGTPNTPSPNNWRYYRYRVYERIIPLKNMLWAVP